MARNEYLHKNLYGLDSAVLDTSYVVYNLFLQNMRGPDQHGADLRPIAPAASAAMPDPGEDELAQTHSSAMSSSGRQASTILPILLQFVSSVVDMEDLPLLAASQRATRLRFLSTVFAAGLPPSCRTLVEVLGKLNTKILEVFSAEVPATQPPRQQRLNIQAQVRGAISALKLLRTEFEDALNAISEFADAELEKCRSGGALNDDDNDDRDTAQLQAVYDRCEALYSSTIAPRISVAEMLCAVRSSLAVRTEEVAVFAHKQLLGMLDACPEVLGWCSVPGTSRRFALLSDETVDSLEASCGAPEDGADSDDGERWRRRVRAVGALRVLATEIHATTRMKLDAVVAMVNLYEALRQDIGNRKESKEVLESRLEDACTRLLESGVMDAEGWVADLVTQRSQQQQRDAADAREAPSAVGVVGSPIRVASFKGMLSRQNSSSGDHLLLSTNSGSGRPPPSPSASLPQGFSAARSSSAGQSRDTSSRRLETAGRSANVDLRETLASLSALLEEIQVSGEGTTSSSVLYDLLGRVNLFLRRNGLAHEAMRGSGDASGKYVPVLTDDATTFVPHDVDDVLGFGKVESELYTRACLLHDQLALQSSVQRRLDALASMPDDEFFQECHDDLLEALLQSADDACIVSPSRRTVERRLQQLMVVRVKLFHHTGAVRLQTVPQRVTLDELRSQWKELFPDALQCRVYYLDDGDRVMLSTAQEYRELLRLRRSLVLDGAFGGASASLNASRSMLNRSAVATSNDLKLELYLDSPSAVVPAPRGKNSANTNSANTIAANTNSAKSSTSQTPSVVSSTPTRPLPATPVKPQQPQPPQVPLPAPPDIFSQIPPGMTINDYIRVLDQNSNVPQASAFIERRHAALVGATTDAPSPGYRPQPNEPPPHQPPASLPGGAFRPPTTTTTPATAQPSALVEHAVKPNVEARRMFLQMGKQGRTAEDIPSNQQLPSPSAGKQQQQQQQIVDHNSSVVVISPSKGRWAPPKNEPHAVLVAQHALTDSLQQPKPLQQQQAPTALQRARAEAEKFFDDDDDELVDPKPSWNRGTDNHVQAVLYGGGQQQQQVRHNGPLRRNGVPTNISPQKKAR
jgi:hypothetical protein